MTATDSFHDRNVEAVIARMRERARVGLEKYGADTTREDFTSSRWLQELQEELMDSIVYIEAVKNKLQAEENRERLEVRYNKPPCPNCLRLQNEIDRHECREVIHEEDHLSCNYQYLKAEVARLNKAADNHECRGTRFYGNSIKFYNYLKDFDLEKHFERWDILDQGQNEGEV